MPHGEELVTLKLARRIYAARLGRDLLFSEAVFDQPAWSLMLDLYVASREGRMVNTFGACIGALVPASTALKWLERMEQAGLITRRPSALDHRYLLVELTPDAMARMEMLLTRLADQLRTELGGTGRDPA